MTSQPRCCSIKHSKTLAPVVLTMEMLSAVVLRPLPSHGMLRVPSHPAAQVRDKWRD
jgi:hypothetical protein